MKDDKNLKYFSFYFTKLNNSVGNKNKEFLKDIENLTPKMIIFTFSLMTAWALVKEIIFKLR